MTQRMPLRGGIDMRQQGPGRPAALRQHRQEPANRGCTNTAEGCRPKLRPPGPRARPISGMLA
jgi:hypothetical protein